MTCLISSVASEQKKIARIILRRSDRYDKHSSRVVIKSDKRMKMLCNHSGLSTLEADGPGGQLRDLVVFQGFPVYFLPPIF